MWVLVLILDLFSAFMLINTHQSSELHLVTMWAKNDFLVWRGVSPMLICHLAFSLITDIKWVTVLTFKIQRLLDEVFGCQTSCWCSVCGQPREDRSLPWSGTKTHLILIISMNKDPGSVSCDPSGLRFPLMLVTPFTVKRPSPGLGLFTSLPVCSS